jgi:hypothetical protein
MTQHSHPNAPTQFADTANFAARDENVRCLSYGVLRKLAGLPQDMFADYWRDVLGTLCARLPGISYYVQHHFSQDHRANLWPLPDGIQRMDVVLDGAAEIGFADIDGLNDTPRQARCCSETCSICLSISSPTICRGGHIRWLIASPTAFQTGRIGCTACICI